MKDRLFYFKIGFYMGIAGFLIFIVGFLPEKGRRVADDSFMKSFMKGVSEWSQ